MTNLLDKLKTDVKDAMKARDAQRVQALRMFVNSVQLEEKSKLRDLDDSEVVVVLQREKKRRVEAAEAFELGGHQDRAAAEHYQADLLDSYLPEQLSNDDLMEIIQTAIVECGAKDPSAMGLVMKTVMPKVAGRADGKAVSAAVSQALRG